MKRTVPFILSILTGCTSALLAPLQKGTSPAVQVAASATLAPNPSASEPAVQASNASSPAPSATPSPAPSPTGTFFDPPDPTPRPSETPGNFVDTPDPTPRPSETPGSFIDPPDPTPTPTTAQGTLGVTFDNAISPVGFIGYGEKKRLATYRLTASGEDFEVYGAAMSWRNTTSENTNVFNVVLSVGTESITTYPTLGVTPSNRSWNIFPRIVRNTIRLLHVDALLTEDVTRNGNNPGDKVAIALHSISAVGAQSAVSAVKDFAPPLMGNTLTVVPFAIQKNAASLGGTQQPQVVATIAIWDFLSLLMSEFGMVNLKSIRISVAGSGGGPLKNILVVNSQNQPLSTAISALSVSATADIPFTASIPFSKNTKESLTLRADTTSYNQTPSAITALSISLIGYTIQDRANPSREIFIDLSNEPVYAPTIVY